MSDIDEFASMRFPLLPVSSDSGSRVARCKIITAQADSGLLVSQADGLLEYTLHLSQNPLTPSTATFEGELSQYLSDRTAAHGQPFDIASKNRLHVKITYTAASPISLHPLPFPSPSSTPLRIGLQWLDFGTAVTHLTPRFVVNEVLVCQGTGLENPDGVKAVYLLMLGALTFI